MSLGEDEFEEGARKLKLKVVYEDTDVLVVTAPNEDELIKILLDLLKDKPMSVKELHTILSGLASEDKIRRALIRLVNDGVVYMQTDGRFIVAGI
ncbi:MAG: hypothetical protein RMH77_05700 [Sulfolobales archaeon]|nr:hypothetical protein [Sulfolobales archaeon]MCX8186787.1 hypothetical protein [Sulfolobales archaeon]MDW7969880.1 hypothetical protein [Sulfolobales archaeon]